MKKVKILDLQIFIDEDLCPIVVGKCHHGTNDLILNFSSSYCDKIFNDFVFDELKLKVSDFIDL